MFLPAFFANTCPVFAKKLSLPFGKAINKNIFGENKTYRGFIFGTLGAFLILTIQKLFLKNDFFHSITLLDLSFSNLFIFSIVFGFGALFGDLIKSFFKRRLKIASGKAFVPFDQLDFILSSMLFLYPFYKVSLIQAVIVLSITPFLHLASNIIAFALKLKKVWY